MAPLHFTGPPHFVRLAADQTGHTRPTGAVGRIEPLQAIANLCAQAVHADPRHVPAILAEADRFLADLHVAFRAGGLMLCAVREAFAGSPFPCPESLAANPELHRPVISKILVTTEPEALARPHAASRRRRP